MSTEDDAGMAHAPSDKEIQQDVAGKLDSNPGLDASEVTTVVSNGRVKLSGTVSSKDELERAESVALTAAGVRDVQNDIQSTSSAYHRWTNKMPGEEEP